MLQFHARERSGRGSVALYSDFVSAQSPAALLVSSPFVPGWKETANSTGPNSMLRRRSCMIWRGPQSASTVVQM